jgi:hypothetical protein
MKSIKGEGSMITKKDILTALGAEVHEDHFLSGMLVGIGVGAIVGGAVAMLFAPKTGPELRQMIGERVPEYLEKAKAKVGLGNGNGGKTETATTTGTGTLGATTPPREPIR